MTGSGQQLAGQQTFCNFEILPKEAARKLQIPALLFLVSVKILNIFFLPPLKKKKKKTVGGETERRRRRWWWCLQVVGQREEVQRCVCECVRDLGPRPKGVIFAGCSSLHCSNLLEMYYVTGPGHIHTETHTHTHTHTSKHSPDPHPLPLLRSLKENFHSIYASGLWVFGGRASRGGQSACAEGESRTETEGRGKQTRRFCNCSGLWSLTADQIMLSVVMLK